MTMNILTKGFDFDYADQTESWTETSNYKNYDIIFIDLNNLYEKGKYGHPAESSENSLNMPNTEDIAQLMLNERHIFILNPPSPHLKVEIDEWKEESMGSLNVFYWLPFKPFFETRGGDAIECQSWNWDWYFDENFQYKSYLGAVESTPLEYGWTPHPEKGYTLENERRDDATELEPHVKRIATNPAAEPVAARIYVNTETEMERSRRERSYSRPNRSGGVYLIPLKSKTTPQEFAAGVLKNKFDLNINEGAGRLPPWVNNYRLPLESEIINDIERLKHRKEVLKSKIKEPSIYKQLLFETGERLENIVIGSLEDLGLDVEGEIPGKRDGLITISGKKIVIEIHGKTSNVKKSKCRQLAEWKLNYLEENPGADVEGLLILNQHREKKPEERPNELLSSEQMTFMRTQDLKALSTIDLYRAVFAHRNDDFDKDDFEKGFNSADVIVSFDDIDNAPV